jgi:hypothetical protein
MAVGILEQSEEHSFRHDLESFFWVLYYLLALPTDRDQDARYMSWSKVHLNAILEGGSNSKLGIIATCDVWINPIYSVMADRMKALMDLFANRRHLRHFKGPRELLLQLYPELTYESFLDIIDNALHDLEGADVSRVPPLPLESLESKPYLHRSSGTTRTTTASVCSCNLSHPAESGGSSKCGLKRGRSSIEEGSLSNVKRRRPA